MLMWESCCRTSGDYDVEAAGDGSYRISGNANFAVFGKPEHLGKDFSRCLTFKNEAAN